MKTLAHDGNNPPTLIPAAPTLGQQAHDLPYPAGGRRDLRPRLIGSYVRKTASSKMKAYEVFLKEEASNATST
jgi:hypothetical protein